MKEVTSVVKRSSVGDDWSLASGCFSSVNQNNAEKITLISQRSNATQSTPRNHG